MIRQIYNLIMYSKWTDCKHTNKTMKGFHGWVCVDCGVEG